MQAERLSRLGGLLSTAEIASNRAAQNPPFYSGQVWSSLCCPGAAFPLPPGNWVSFVDVGAETGLREIIYGGVEHQKYILETSGAGVAIFDYD